MPTRTSKKRPDQLPRGRHHLSRETVVQSQQKRLLEAMIEVVAEQGYADARIADVVTEAGVSRKTYYDFFADKEACFLAAYDASVAQLIDAVTTAFEAEADATWPERVRDGLAALLDRLAAEPAMAKACVVEVLSAGPKALVRRDAAIRQLTHFIDAGRSEAKTALPGIVSLAVVGGIHELLYSEIIHGATSQLPARLPDLTHWVVQPFLGDERADKERERAREWMSARPTPAGQDSDAS